MKPRAPLAITRGLYVPPGPLGPDRVDATAGLPGNPLVAVGARSAFPPEGE